jgi:hypothetical protein
MIVCSDCRERPRAARCAGLCAECFAARMARARTKIKSLPRAAEAQPTTSNSLLVDEPQPQGGSPSHEATVKPKQAALFHGYKSMSLLDMLRESGRLRKQMYWKHWKQVRHEKQQEKAKATAQADDEAEVRVK